LQESVQHQACQQQLTIWLLQAVAAVRELVVVVVQVVFVLTQVLLLQAVHQSQSLLGLVGLVHLVQ
jgi:hypothetical protein